jgi:hypothetical protein
MRYRTYLQNLNSFLIVSGKFAKGDEALDGRSKDFISEHQVPLSFMTADTLGEIIEILAENPVVRRAINWSRIFSDSVVQVSRVSSEVHTVLQDETVGPR